MFGTTELRIKTGLKTKKIREQVLLNSPLFLCLPHLQGDVSAQSEHSLLHLWLHGLYLLNREQKKEWKCLPIECDIIT